MSRTQSAIILPIADLDLARDQGRKLRLVGHVTAVDPLSANVVLSSGADANILVDLTLCIHPDLKEGVERRHAGGWNFYRETQQRSGNGASMAGMASLSLIPPELKSKLMVIGYLERREVAMDTSFTSSQNLRLDSSDPRIQPKISGQDLNVNKWFMLQAILAKDVGPDFDINLWEDTARLRSQDEWKDYYSSNNGGMRKGKERQIQPPQPTNKKDWL